MAVADKKILAYQSQFLLLRQPALNLVSSFFALRFKLIFTQTSRVKPEFNHAPELEEQGRGSPLLQYIILPDLSITFAGISVLGGYDIADKIYLTMEFQLLSINHRYPNDWFTVPHPQQP